MKCKEFWQLIMPADKPRVDDGFSRKPLREIKRWIEGELLGAGVEPAEAVFEPSLIIEKATEWALARQVLEEMTPLNGEQLECVRRIVAMRKVRLPLQYCLGEAGFMGLRLSVRTGVFIPRPETETLVEVASRWLEKCSRPSAAAAEEQQNAATERLLEIGVGAGPVSIALLKRFPCLRITAVDLNPAAIALAHDNAACHGVLSRLELIESSWEDLDALCFDAVVSNPPYIPARKAGSLQAEVELWEPAAALWGSDPDGIGFYRRFAETGRALLKSGGFVAFEVDDHAAQSVVEIFGSGSWSDMKVGRDLSGVPRVFSCIAA